MRLCHAFRRTVAFAEAPKTYVIRSFNSSAAPRPNIFSCSARKKPAKNYLHSTGPSTMKGESCAFDTSFYQALEYPNSGASTSAEELLAEQEKIR